MKITLHSAYDSFTLGRKPKYIEWTSEDTPIHCYVNEYVKEVKEPNGIAILIEPRSILPDIYRWVERHAVKFRIIFTHDDELLKLDNAKILIFGGVWSYSDCHKSKGISMISSNKQQCPLHTARLQLAKQLEDKIDCFGYKDRVTTYEAHAPYRFAVVIENYRSDWWFTEKICNCFANKTIPIYYGAKKISEIFDPDGIIEVKNLEDIPQIIDSLDIPTEYAKRQKAIKANYERVKAFECFEDTFFRMYGGLLNDTFNHNTGL